VIAQRPPRRLGRLGQRVPGLIDPFPLPVRQCQTHQRFGVMGVDLDGRSVLFERFIRPTETRQQQAVVVAKIGVTRMTRHGRPVSLELLVQPGPGVRALCLLVE